MNSKKIGILLSVILISGVCFANDLSSQKAIDVFLDKYDTCQDILSEQSQIRLKGRDLPTISDINNVLDAIKVLPEYDTKENKNKIEWAIKEQVKLLKRYKRSELYASKIANLRIKLRAARRRPTRTVAKRPGQGETKKVYPEKPVEEKSISEQLENKELKPDQKTVELQAERAREQGEYVGEKQE